MIITVLLTAVFLILGLTFWAWSSPEVIDTSPIGAINAMNPALTVLIEVLVMVMTFVFLSVTVIKGESSFLLSLYILKRLSPVVSR